MDHTFIASRLDYCNALLCGITDYEINYLQLIKNNVAYMMANMIISPKLLKKYIGYLLDSVSISKFY